MGDILIFFALTLGLTYLLGQITNNIFVIYPLVFIPCMTFIVNAIRKRKEKLREIYEQDVAEK